MTETQFISIPGKPNAVGLRCRQTVSELPGVWPLVDEGLRFTGIIAVGNKNGIDEKIDLRLLKRSFPGSRFIFNCQKGPYRVRHYEEIRARFDGHMTLDFDPSDSKSLSMSHSMMVRSMPFESFFWESSKEKVWKYGILTDVGNDTAKKWGRCVRIVDRLCSNGLSSLVVIQSEIFDGVLGARLTKERIFKIYAERGLLKISSNVENIAFHRLQNIARVGIFPNACDAFPKNIIENILADKPIVISDDLLIGKSAVSPDFREIVDFDSKSGLDRCLEIAKKWKGRKEGRNDRDRWIRRYGFPELAGLWAEQLNEKFDKDCEMAFFMNHVGRAKKASLIEEG